MKWNLKCSIQHYLFPPKDKNWSQLTYLQTNTLNRLPGAKASERWRLWDQLVCSASLTATPAPGVRSEPPSFSVLVKMLLLTLFLQDVLPLRWAISWIKIGEQVFSLHAILLPVGSLLVKASLWHTVLKGRQVGHLVCFEYFPGCYLQLQGLWPGRSLQHSPNRGLHIPSTLACLTSWAQPEEQENRTHTIQPQPAPTERVSSQSSSNSSLSRDTKGLHPGTSWKVPAVPLLAAIC